MAQYSDTCFLCGYFSSRRPRPDGIRSLTEAGWTMQPYDKAAADEYRRFYYPEFVDFWLGSGDGDNDRPVVTFTAPCSDGEGPAIAPGCEGRLHGIRLCLMPFGMVLYAIEFALEGDDLNAFTLTLARLRTGFASVPAIVRPLRRAMDALGAPSDAPIIESGNKLKIFHIVRCLTPEAVAAAAGDATLFQLGSLVRVSPYDPSDPDEISPSYLASTIRDSKLSFYNNWTALALFDTFTILAHDVPDWMVKNWCEDYFGKIYMHGLFSKFYLYRQNARFRADPDAGEDIEKELNEFERTCCFHHISYNFMPGEVDRAIDRSLDLAPERSLLRSYIATCNEQRAKTSDRRVNALLTLLTVLTVASTLWDFSSMVNALYPFGTQFGSEATGFRAVVSAAILIILCAVLYIMLPRRKKA